MGLLYLVMSGLLWGTGGLTGSLLGRIAGLSAMPVAAYRLTVGGALIVALLMVTGRRWPGGRAAWVRITAIGLLAAQFQACYFIAVSLTSVSLATLITVGSAPVIVLCVERVTTRCRIGRLKAGAACLALAGLGLLVGLPSGGLIRLWCSPGRAWRCSRPPGSLGSPCSAKGRYPDWTT
jgi:DME family drug/metabolite transporter